MPGDEELRHALMKMLPGNMSVEMRGKAWAQTSAADLEDWVRTQDEFEQDYCHGKPLHLNESEQSRVPASLPAPPNQLALSDEELAEGYAYGEEEDLDPEVLATMTAAEVNAFMRGRGQRTWQTQQRRNGQRPGGHRVVSWPSLMDLVGSAVSHLVMGRLGA